MSDMEKDNGARAMTAHDISYAAAGVALMAVSAWVSIPLGPVPFTLQTLAATFIAVAFTPKRALASILAYVVLGAVGIPVFSGMRGGFGVLFGPTGGFIIALIPAIILASAIVSRKDDTLGRAIAGFVLVGVMYLLGWLWLMVSANLTPMAAFAAACAPFIVPDVVKVIVGVMLAQVVRSAVPALAEQH